jgi:hypothetical protein
MPAETTIDIDRPAEVVFGYLTDPARFAEWQSDVLEVRVDADRPTGVGATFTTTRRIGRAELTMAQRVTLYDPPYRWAVAVRWEYRLGGGVTHVRHTRPSFSRGTGQAGSGRKPVWVPSNGRSPASISVTSRSPSERIARVASVSK